LALRCAMESWVDWRRETRLRRERDLQRRRQLGILERMAGEQDSLLLRGALMEWHGEAEALRRARQMERACEDELRRYRERHQDAVRRIIGAMGNEQAAMFRRSVFSAWRDVAAGAVQSRRHAERVFQVMCQGDAELALRAAMESWVD